MRALEPNMCTSPAASWSRRLKPAVWLGWVWCRGACLAYPRARVLFLVLFLSLFLGLFLGLGPTPATAQENCVLEQPAQRVISLAPHLTELVYAAGAAEQLVAVVNYSDYPPAARELPQVGGYEYIDIERVMALQPDLIFVWPTGNRSADIERLQALDLAICAIETRHLADIPRALRLIARATGHSASGEQAARQFADRLAQLQRPRAAPVTVLYQIWHQPILTLNGQHIISEAIAACGGRNVFADLPTLVPTVSEEAVLLADPEAIVASGMLGERPAGLSYWQRWPQLRAVQRDNLFTVPADLIQRPGPRMIEGIERLCTALDQARARRTATRQH